jgi:hypothetical protein
VEISTTDDLIMRDELGEIIVKMGRINQINELGEIESIYGLTIGKQEEFKATSEGMSVAGWSM